MRSGLCWCRSITRWWWWSCSSHKHFWTCFLPWNQFRV
jgi:hypothetical protein